MVAMRSAARSDVGLVRKGNEDSGYAGTRLLVVADGMGGHAAGELASATALATVCALDQSDLSAADVLPALAAAVDDSSAHIAEIVASEPDVAGMGTTVTAVYWAGPRIAVVHVGDSRAYLMREGSLIQLTNDHTYVQTLVDAGRITPDEATRHPRRNILMRAIDGSYPVEADLSVREARPGDRYLLCSDGLTGVVSDNELSILLSEGDPTGTVTRLVDLALERGAPDNVTVVVADIVDGTEPMSAAPVVVGAAGEPRVRAQLPQLAFPEDAQVDPNRPDLPPPAEGPPTSPQPAIRTAIPVSPSRAEPRSRAWLRPVGLVIAVVLAIAVVGVGATTWVRSQWYVGDSGGYVSVYRGIQGSLAGLQLQNVEQTTSIPVNELPSFDRELVAKGIPASNLSDAQRIIDELARRANPCFGPTPPAGCP